MTWRDLEDQSLKAQQPRDIEVTTCPKCDCSWFYKIKVNRFSTKQVSILQEPDAVNPNDLTLLVCAKCNTRVRHNVAYYQITKERRLYDQMLNDVIDSTKTTDNLILEPNSNDEIIRNEIPNSGQEQETTPGNKQ